MHTPTTLDTETFTVDTYVDLSLYFHPRGGDGERACKAAGCLKAYAGTSDMRHHIFCNHMDIAIQNGDAAALCFEYLRESKKATEASERERGETEQTGETSVRIITPSSPSPVPASTDKSTCSTVPSHQSNTGCDTNISGAAVGLHPLCGDLVALVIWTVGGWAARQAGYTGWSEYEEKVEEARMEANIAKGFGKRKAAAAHHDLAELVQSVERNLQGLSVISLIDCHTHIWPVTPLDTREQQLAFLEKMESVKMPQNCGGTEGLQEFILQMCDVVREGRRFPKRVR
ncbi:hypothetical protein KIPB_006117 [Kipferlia bialata]|uniref:Uncharacterized protein n=1 Tax=Kipferlia bialata TaxID=797122 RepID=A0A9K3CY18_9EUKA|nr:hypothetical protein KIPB_006117 [Kipferlia bialata]|eukprot:g6117.t1